MSHHCENRLMNWIIRLYADVCWVSVWVGESVLLFEFQTVHIFSFAWMKIRKRPIDMICLLSWASQHHTDAHTHTHIKYNLYVAKVFSLHIQHTWDKRKRYTEMKIHTDTMIQSTESRTPHKNEPHQIRIHSNWMTRLTKLMMIIKHRL